MSWIKFGNTSVSCVICYSFYNYDPSETYLLSVITGGVSVEYSYNTNGDLSGATTEDGYLNEIGYNDNNFVESIREYAINNELISHYTYDFNWNGVLNISVFPQNASRVLRHDRLGTVVSVTNDGGLPEISQEIPYGRRVLLGDEVSFKFGSEKFLHIFDFRSSQKIVWKVVPHTPLIKKEFKISL